MIKPKKHISFLLTLLIAVGMAFSLGHFHNDSHTHVDGIEYQFTQDINECIICASHFKTSPDANLHAGMILFSEEFLFVHSEIIIVDPLNNIHDGRAPPLFG